MDRNVRKKSDNEVDWTSLPNDLVTRVFSCLNNQDRASLSSSCKPWWILSKSNDLWKSLDLRLYRCDSQVAKSLASRCNNLHKLQIHGQKTAETMINLEAKNLREIRIEYGREITDVDLSVIAARHEALECLQFESDFPNNISSVAINIIGNCCRNLKMLWLSGIMDVNREAIHALANNCQDLTDIKFSNCGKVDVAAIGKVRTLKFFSVAGTINIDWSLALLNWKTLPNLIGLDISRTDVKYNVVSELLISCPSLQVLCAFNSQSIEQNYTSINRSGKKLLAFSSTDILKELAPLLNHTPKQQKDVELEGVLYWLERTVCNSMLLNITLGHDYFWLNQGTVLLLSFLQSTHEKVQETAATALTTFYGKRTETVIRGGGLRLLVKLARSSREGIQLEFVKAIVNLLKTDNMVKVVSDEGGFNVLLNIAISACKIVSTEALEGLLFISSLPEHKRAIGKVGGVQGLVDVIAKWSKRNGGEVIMEFAIGTLANLMTDGKFSIEATSIIPVLVEVLGTGMAHRVHAEATRCLANMASHEDSIVAAIGQERGAIEALVQHVSSHHDSVRHGAAMALWMLSSNEENMDAIAAVGGLQAMVALANSCVNASFELQELGAGMLWSLSTMSEENRIVIGEEGGLTTLIVLLSSNDEKVHMNAAGALTMLMYDSRNAMRIVQENGVSPFVQLCSSSGSHIARFLSAQALAAMFDKGLDELAVVGTSSESTSKISRLKTVRREASRAIKAFLESYYHPLEFSAAASLTSPTASVTRIIESVRVKEADQLEISIQDVGRFVNMLGHRSHILKSFGAFSFLQFTLTAGSHYSVHQTSLVRQNVDALPKLHKAAASDSHMAKVFAQIVLWNLECHDLLQMQIP